MNGAEIGGIVRTAAAFGLGFLVNKGVIDNETALQVAGAIGTIAVAVWSIVAKRKAVAGE